MNLPYLLQLANAVERLSGAVRALAAPGAERARREWFDRFAIAWTCSGRPSSDAYPMADELWQRRTEFMLERRDRFVPRPPRAETVFWSPELDETDDG